MKKYFNFKIIAVAAVVIYLSVSLITSQFELMTKRQQKQILEEEKQRVQLEVDDVENVLENEDEEEYIERVARQRLGYANPNEKVFKDIQGE